MNVPEEDILEDGVIVAGPDADEDLPDPVGVSGEAESAPVVPLMKDTAQGKTPKKGKGGAHAKEGQSAYIQKSARMRKILIAVIVILIILLAAMGVLGYKLFDTARMAAVQQTQTAEVESIDAEEAAKDASAAVSKKTTVPDLVALIGLTQDEAIEMLQHGAQVTGAVEVNEEDNPVRSEIKIALTTEPSDTRSGAPTVFLSLDEEGVAIRAGYSAATSSLGYGSLSFSDAIQNEYIIEKTLEEAGLTVQMGTVQLPSDKMEYSTYDSDGTTLVKEYCSFEGTGQAKGTEMEWSAVLSYDYSMANATGNLADTIRTIYIYIS